MYCVKCKKRTDTSNERVTTTKNNRHMKRRIYAICRRTKTQFIKAQKGGSLLNKFINNLPVEMRLPGHNFTGPGTKLNKRLTPGSYLIQPLGVQFVNRVMEFLIKYGGFSARSMLRALHVHRWCGLV